MKLKVYCESVCVCTWHTHRTVEIVPDCSIFHLFYSQNQSRNQVSSLSPTVWLCSSNTHFDQIKRLLNQP